MVGFSTWQEFNKILCLWKSLFQASFTDIPYQSFILGQNSNRYLSPYFGPSTPNYLCSNIQHCSKLWTSHFIKSYSSIVQFVEAFLVSIVSQFLQSAVLLFMIWTDVLLFLSIPKYCKVVWENGIWLLFLLLELKNGWWQLPNQLLKMIGINHNASLCAFFRCLCYIFYHNSIRSW